MALADSYRSVLHYDSDESLLKALRGCSVRACNGAHKCEQQQSDWRLSWFDPRTTNLLTVEQEAERLKNLKSFQILDTEPEECFDKLTAEMMEHCKVPWACLSFVDLGRQWFKSVTSDEGLTIRETSRLHSFCAHTILRSAEDPVLEVRDTHLDGRFCCNPLVLGGPKVRFYAGVGLVSPEGHHLGALCILDSVPHPDGLSKQDREKLVYMAEKTVKLMVQRRALKKMPKTVSSEAKMSPDKDAPKIRSFKAFHTPKSPRRTMSKKRSDRASPEEQPERRVSASEEAVPKKRSRSPLPHSPCASGSEVESSVSSYSETDSFDSDSESYASSVHIVSPMDKKKLPDPKASGVHPDKFLADLVEAMFGVKVKVTQALALKDFFLTIKEEQMVAYNMEVVSAARDNNVAKLKTIFQERGRAPLDCFNRFGEGLLNLSCRRGFKEMVQFLLTEVQLDIRLCDDCGRTPLHDACWNPEPQLDICLWILQRDPSLFLVADKRGYTPFQYAREGDWQIWREFLFESRQLLQELAEPKILSKFS